MNLKSLKRDFINGVLFTTPLGIIIYVFIRIMALLEKLISPLAKQIGVTKLLGEFGLTIFALIIILIFCLIIGLILKRARFLRLVGKYIEGFAVKVLPSLSVISSMAKEQMEVYSSDSWKGILINEENSWKLGFLIEENNLWQTIYLPEPPKGEGGEIRVIEKDSINFIFMKISDIRAIFNLHGQGLLSFIPDRKK